jgi:hypothetical protein
MISAKLVKDFQHELVSADTIAMHATPFLPNCVSHVVIFYFENYTEEIKWRSAPLIQISLIGTLEDFDL